MVGSNSEQAQLMQLDQTMDSLHMHVQACSDYGDAASSRSDDTSTSHPAHAVFQVPSHQPSLAEQLHNALSSSPSAHEHIWQCEGIQYPSPPPPSPARFNLNPYDRGRSAGGGLLSDEAWIAMRLKAQVADVEDMGEQKMQSEESSTLAANDDEQVSVAFESEDDMEDETEVSKARSHSHASRTLSKWEELLQAAPRDPMAFYWREMIHWCRARNRCGGAESESGVKRGAQGSEEAMLEESVDLLNRLVKRCRCNDDSVADGAS